MKPQKRTALAWINIFSRPLFGLLLLSPTAQYAPAQCDARLVTATVRESDRRVDTGINVNRGDTLNFSATGSIWAGVFATSTNGPAGWADLRPAPPEFPCRARASTVCWAR